MYKYQIDKKHLTLFKKAFTFVSEHKKTIVLLFLTIIFFSFSIILTYDSAHYLGYVSIFEGNSPASSWDIVRGPVFPLIIHLSDILFGKTSAGILVCTFLFYLSFSAICYIICKDIAKHYKHPKRICIAITAFLILNPLIFGYFHVLLTEFVSITVIMLNLLISYKWIYLDIKNHKKASLYCLYFIFITIFCWHLKQPYIIITLAPLVISLILSIIRNHKKNNVIYRTATLFASLLFLILSIFTWNKMLDLMHVNQDTGRDSSSMLGRQLLFTYQIPFDKNEAQSTKDAISTLMSNFFSNPGNIIGTYFKNYCGLTSICKVSSDNGVDYIATNDIDLLNTYENDAIGYATYRMDTNLFYMSETMQSRASYYATPVGHSIFSVFMKALRYPTNILYKLFTILCLPLTIVLIVIRLKNKSKKHDDLFCISFLLLATSSLHLLLSAAAALVIDRYAVEIFVPSILGTFGTLTYIKLLYSKRTKSHTKLKKKN